MHVISACGRLYIGFVVCIREYICISIYIKQRCLSVCLSMHQLSMVDLRAKPMAYLESAGSCGCFSLVLNQQVPVDVLAWV